MGVSPLTIIRSNPLTNLLFLILLTLCSAGLEILVPKGRNVSTKRHNDSTELKVKTIAQKLWTPRASESTGKEES